MMSILGRVVGSKSRKFSSVAPWLMLPPSFRGRSEMVYNWYSPSKEEVVRFKGKGGKEEADVMRDEATTVVGSSHGWLALLNKRTGNMLLSNPVSGRRMKLPPFRPLKEEEDGDLVKVIISRSADEEGCRALMMPWCDPEERVVSFCCPGSSDDWWAPIKTSSGIDFRIHLDFVYSTARRGFFGCVEIDADPRCRVLEGWDMSGGGDGFPRRMLDRPDMDMYGEGDWPAPERNHAYLAAAEHSDQLYVVRLHVEDPQRLHFDVFRSASDERGGGLEVCSSLDGVVLFVGSNHSMALPSSQFPDLKPNSIYMSDHRLQIRQPFVGIFDYQNRSWSPCCYPPALQLQNFASQYPLTWFTPTSY